MILNPEVRQTWPESGQIHSPFSAAHSEFHMASQKSRDEGSKLPYKYTTAQLRFSHSVVSDSFAIPWTAACQASLSITNSQSLLKLSPLSWWCHPTISSSVIPSSSHFQSCPASGSFQMSQFFTSSGQSIGVSASASVVPMNIHDWFPLVWTGWISLQSKGLSRVFSNTTA